jgi:hypothetical protein
MRVRWSAAIFVMVCLLASAEDGVTVDTAVSTVRSGIAKKHKDAAIAFSLDGMKLSQRLDDRVIEILESEGAGPQSLGVLQRLRDDSRLLPAPPDPPPGMMPPPPLSSAEEQRTWHTATGKAEDYNHALPNFICTETVHRWIDTTAHDEWQPSPTLVADLTYFDQKENYKLLTVEGKKSNTPIAEVGGAFSQGEFGSILMVIFHPNSQTEYRWDHWTMLRKRSTSVYFYRVRAGHHPHQLRFHTTPTDVVSTFVGLHGYVYIDQESGSVMRISAIAEEIPGDFPVQNANTVLDYDYAVIGGARYLLPLRAEVHIDTKNVRNLNSVEFQSYRKFRADANVTFDKE